MGIPTIKLEGIDLLELGNTIQLTGMLLTDSQNYITYLVSIPEEEINNEIINLELTHDDWKKLLRQTDIQETKVLMDDHGEIKKAILRKSTRQIDSNVSWNVYRRDNYTCRYCGRNDVPLTVDHIVLWEDGGPNIEENLFSCCRRCNKIRGNMKYVDWLESPQYQDVSKNLTEEEKRKNLMIVYTLEDIPIRIHKQSRKGSKKKNS